MYKAILTGNQAKQARAALNLSQGKMAASLGINRTYLSQFENGRYLFDDKTLSKLREFFERQGFALPESAPTSSGDMSESNMALDIEDEGGMDGCRVLDGFVVPSRVDEEEADAALSEFAENSRRIGRLCSGAIKEGLLFGIDEEDRDQKARRVLVLMARNYALIEALHGHDAIYPRRGKEQQTIGDHVAHIFAEELSFLDTGERATV